MEIGSSNIRLRRQHSSIEMRMAKESLRMWIGDQQADSERRQVTSRIIALASAIVNLSPEGKTAAQSSPSKQTTEVDPENNLEKAPRYLLIKLMVEALTGKQLKLIKKWRMCSRPSPLRAPPDPNQTAAHEQAEPAEFDIKYDRHEIHNESEQTSFSGEGVVRTTDSREIRFSLDLSMSRERLEQSDVSLRLYDAKK